MKWHNAIEVLAVEVLAVFVSMNTDTYLNSEYLCSSEN